MQQPRIEKTNVGGETCVQITLPDTPGTKDFLEKEYEEFINGEQIASQEERQLWREYENFRKGY